MCLVLFLGSEEKLPILPFDTDSPAFNTKELDESEMGVLLHFSMPQVIHIASHEGCGCSFRHAVYDKGEWSYMLLENEEESVTSQLNHQALVNYLKASNLEKFEIYACWEGDYLLPAEYEEAISAENLLHPDFFFRERALYRITHGN